MPTSLRSSPTRPNYVDTLIGTGSSATGGQINNFPDAAVPFGMVQYSPDTTDAYAGYHHDNDHVRGFSLTHARASVMGWRLVAQR